MAPFKVIIGKYKEKLEVFQNLLEEYKKYIIVCRIERLSNCKMIRLRFYRTSHPRNLNWIYITSSAPHWNALFTPPHSLNFKVPSLNPNNNNSTTSLIAVKMVSYILKDNPSNMKNYLRRLTSTKLQIRCSTTNFLIRSIWTRIQGTRPTIRKVKEWKNELFFIFISYFVSIDFKIYLDIKAVCIAKLVISVFFCLRFLRWYRFKSRMAEFERINLGEVSNFLLKKDCFGCLLLFSNEWGSRSLTSTLSSK